MYFCEIFTYFWLVTEFRSFTEFTFSISDILPSSKNVQKSPSFLNNVIYIFMRELFVTLNESWTSGRKNIS